MNIRYRDLRDHKIIMLKGELDYFCSRDIRDAILQLMHENVKSMILDLKEVTFIDSAGMGMLVNVKKELEKNNCTIGFLNISADIMILMKLATLDRILQIYNNEDEIK